ncbi:MAG: transposase [Bryobacteraceae bacterium]
MREYFRRLPHFQPENAYIFLTWRLYGSIPVQKDTRYATDGHAFVAADRAMDRDQSSPRWLKEPAVASVVAEAIRIGAFERQFYELYAWAVMANHVHLLILPKAPIPVLMRWLKGSTARKANQLLGRTGKPFWRDESHDHWIRNREQLRRLIRCIEANPVVADLVSSAELWPWSSAYGQAKPPAPPLAPAT